MTEKWGSVRGAMQAPHFRYGVNRTSHINKLSNANHSLYYPDRLQARGAKANACGIVQLKDLPRQPFAAVLRLPTTTGKTARFTVADLPTFLPPICHKTALLVPPGWSPSLAQAVLNSENETMEIGFGLPNTLIIPTSSSGGSSSGGIMKSTGITGPIVSCPGWSGISVGYVGYEQVQAAKTPDNTIVIAEFPAPSYGDGVVVGRSDVGPDVFRPYAPQRTPCGYVVLNKWRGSGVVVYRLSPGGEFDPVASFELDEVPTLSGKILEDLVAGCKS